MATSGAVVRNPLFKAVVAVVLASASVFVTGCTVLSSSTIEELAEAGAAPNGKRYCLPKFMMKFELAANANTSQFEVRPGAPYAVSDSKQCFYLNYRALPQYDDHITINTNARGYLSQITANTDDRTVDIIKNLAKIVGAFGQPFESTATDGWTILTDDTIDPTSDLEIDRMVSKFTVQLRAFSKGQVKKCENSKPKPNIASLNAEISCRAFRRFAAMPEPIAIGSRPYQGVTSRNVRNVSLKGDPLVPIDAEHPLQADCKVGVCYRPLQPWILGIGIGQSGATRTPYLEKGLDAAYGYETVQASVYLLPNQSDLIELDIRRAFLVKKVQTIKFDESGILDTVSVMKDSELEALSSIPLEIISGIAEGLTLKIAILDQQIASTNAERELIEARAKLQKERIRLMQMEGARVAFAGQSAAVRTPSHVLTTLPGAALSSGVPPIDRLPVVE